MHKALKRRNIKVRSISVEDLGSMAKRMIDGALNDTDLIAKLHRDFCEELCSKKLREFKGYEFNDNSAKASSQMPHESAMLMHDKSKGDSKEDEKSIFVEEKNYEDTDLLSSCQRNNRNIVDVTSFSTALKNESFIVNKALTETTEIQRQDRRSTSHETKRIDEAFEIWKREKTKAIRRMLKEERNKREQELAAQQNEIERKRAALEAHLNWKRQRVSQRKFKEMQKKPIGDSRLEKTRTDAKNVANEEAFRAWKIQKDRQLRQQFCQPERERMKRHNIRHCDEMEFDSWLDRLDSVLHKKYLRERRYLVHSFYCQPTYYGSAALSKS